MITYKEYISEGITFDGEDLRFLYNDNSKDLVSTKFGKSKKFTPFVTTIEKELKAYSLYNSRDATATLKAIKAADFSNPEVHHFIERSAIYGAKILRENPVDVIITPRSSSELTHTFTQALQRRTHHDYFFNQFTKNPDISEVGIDVDHPSITPTIIDSMTNIIAKANEREFISMRNFHPSHRKFITNLFTVVDDRLESKVSGKRVAIIDDVVTSGTTAYQIYKILMNNGADSVYALTLFKPS